MKTIQLLSLSLNNFKGIQSLAIDFSQNVSIYGENATGKSTIADAIKWILFDKDSTDRKDFEIKTLDSDGNAIPGLDHTVIATFSVGGVKKVLQKTFREKWVKKRGEAESVFTGNETLYYINEVPLGMGEYKKAIAEFADENIFKLLTDPLYFSTQFSWKDRRNILLNLSGNITPDYVINSNGGTLIPLIELFKEQGSIENIRKMLANRKKKVNDDIKNIPARIDECRRSIIPLDFEQIGTALASRQTELDQFETQLAAAVKVDPERAAKENMVRMLVREAENIRLQVDSTFNRQLLSTKVSIEKDETAVRDLERKIITDKSNLKREADSIGWIEADIETIRSRWIEEDAKTLNITEQFICPTCNRQLEASDIEKKKTELQQNFNLQKAKNLERITEEGNYLQTKKKASEDAIKIAELRIAETQEIIEKLRAQILTTSFQIKNMAPSYGSRYNDLINEIAQAEEDLLSSVRGDLKSCEAITRELTAQKKTIQTDIALLEKQLNQKEINERMEERISELSYQERKLAQQIADIEKNEFLCEKFTRTEAELLSNVVNGKFKYVNFRLFNSQINGGVEPCCEPLINGVGFADANKAARVNAGLDIINSLSNFYGITAPIIIDNAESVLSLIPTESQVIRLVVSEGDKVLRVN